MTSIDAAVITGAGRGIGKAIATYWGAQGVHILCISKTLKVEETVKKINDNGGVAEALALDISNYVETEKIVRAWIKKNSFKRLGLFLAAGVLGPKGGLMDTELSDWDVCFQTNVLGNLAVLKALLPRIKQEKYARIVFFSGGGAAFPFPAFSAYSASKTAIVRIVENLHEELIDQGDFKIIALAPGTVKTDMLQSVIDAGVIVNKFVDVNISVKFVADFTNSKENHLSGRFFHVTNDWKEFLQGKNPIENKSYWKLRVDQNKDES